MKRLVLVGGGHAHVEVVRRFAVEPPSHARVTLVSPEPDAPYSGMLPGLIAGHYTRSECHIPLAPLCRRAGVELILAAVVAVDADRGAVELDDGRTLGWDLLTLDTGSAPDAGSVPGAAAFAVPVKPVSRFLRAWEELLRTRSRAGARVVVVGGGAAGVEVALAMRHRLTAEPAPAPSVALVARELLPSHPAAVGRRVERALGVAGVELLRGREPAEVGPEEVRLRDGTSLPSDLTVWATGASAPAWLEGSSLAVDGRGFVRVDATLRSESHPRVLATGDVSSFSPRGLPKAGVYAVRQGPVLARNILRLLRGEPPTSYAPQRRFLSILALGPRRAVASWGPWSAEGAWVSRLKDRIDRRFMSRYAAP